MPLGSSSDAPVTRPGPRLCHQRRFGADAEESVDKETASRWAMRTSMEAAERTALEQP